MKEASLVIVEDLQNNAVLMVENKRGINAGFYNFPGGKKNENEDMLACATREVIEETGIMPLSLAKVGYIEFFGKDFFVTVYKSNEFMGKIKSENEEARAFWQDRNNLPFQNMRNADKDFVPLIMNGMTVNRRYFYDNDFKITKIEDI